MYRDLSAYYCLVLLLCVCTLKVLAADDTSSQERKDKQGVESEEEAAEIVMKAIG